MYKKLRECIKFLYYLCIYFDSDEKAYNDYICWLIDNEHYDEVFSK